LTRWTTLWLGPFVVLVLVAGCGDDRMGTRDGGSARDGGAVFDAAGGDDAGDVMDAGSVADAGAMDAPMPDASAGATVMGTITLPGSAPGATFGVRLAATPGAITTPIAQTSGKTMASTTLPYEIADVPAGTYFLLAFVDVDGSGGSSSTPGDFAGWYGHTGDGNPPPAANVIVPASGSVTLDFALVIR
jgi:hypothetical protein